MIWFATSRLLKLIATLVVAAALLFALFETAGDPARFMLGPTATPQAVADLGVVLRVGEPAVERFPRWLGEMATGDFGQSVSQGAAVGGLVGTRLLVTLPLLLLGAIVAVAIGGTGLAMTRAGWSRRIVGVLARIGAAVPDFWLGLVLVLMFSLLLHLLPPGGFVPWQQNPPAALASLVLPALALGIPYGAMMAATVGTTFAAARDSGAVRLAMAGGLDESAAMRLHGLRTALPALLVAVRRLLPGLVAGGLIVETVFYLPGLGRLLLDAAAAHDLVLARGGLFVTVGLIAVAMFGFDLWHGLADPRLTTRRSA